MRNKLCGESANRLVKNELYDQLINFFIKSESKCLEVEVLGINTSHLIANLNMSIEEKGLEKRPILARARYVDYKRKIQKT